MSENSQKKMLIESKKTGLFYKIKLFFKKLFGTENDMKEVVQTVENNTDIKNSFMESIKDVNNDETKLLKLQSQFRNHEINPEELTQEQVDSLLELYDKQISDLKVSIEMKRQKISEFKNKAKA